MSDWKFHPYYPIFNKYPPAIILTTECDPLHDESLEYNENWKSWGKASSEKRGTFHAFIQFTDLMPKHTDECYTWLSEQMQTIE